MDLEVQLCPFVHAKQLKKLGVMQKSLFNYTNKGITIKIQENFVVVDDLPTGADWQEDAQSYISAFTVAELGVMLPYAINGIVIIMENSEEIRYVSYPRIKTTFGSTEAQARANMLIWLIENKYITAKEVNKRLMGA